MQKLDSNTACRMAIVQFIADHLRDVDPALQPGFIQHATSNSVVAQTAGVGEFVWANRDAMPDAAKELAASLISFASSEGWHGLDDDGRGAKIVANLRKDLGEIKSAPAAPGPGIGIEVVGA